ncbi:MAG TPA: RluA family pseudouridine synthase [Gaiellaceae bacterium]|nr:RluA family pseudouridine synthase [Gaiellaceae bacterium]
MARVTVPDTAAGLRLDRFLADLPEIGSRAAAERLLEGGAVVVDGEQAPKSRRLQGGEDVEFQPAEPEPKLAPEELELRIAYEDEHLLVVDKPAGVVVHPAPGHRTGTLVHGVLALGAAGGDEERPGIVHRLDRDTSGLLIVARSDEAYERLKDLVKAHGLERTYTALVRGRPRSKKGRIEAPIGRDRRDPTRQSMNTDSPRAAVTHFELLELLGQHALLRVDLETGRTHQIRVHLGAIGLPVVGDPVYGVPDPALGRQFLHAARLAFEHPFTAERVEVESPLPGELARHLAELR